MPENTTVFDVEELRVLVAEALDLPVTEVTDTASFIDDLGVDSLMSLEIATSVEQRYGVSVDDNDLKDVTDFAAVRELVEGKLRERR